MKRMMALMLTVALCCGAWGGSLAAQEEVTGELVIYSSMYQFALDMLDEAIKKEFPNLTPGNDGSFFVYGGSTSLIVKLYDQMREGKLECDMMMVAEPSLSLEMKEAGYLAPVAIPGIGEKLRFPYDEEGYWYPVRVCNMVLAYNPEMEADWAAKGKPVPQTFKDFAGNRALKGYISMGDPLTSGTTFSAVASLTQADHYGRQYLKSLAANGITVESGSKAIRKIREGEIVAAMILEESVLKTLKDAEDAGEPITNLACLYPEDGVILIPSTVMTVAEERSKNGNAAAAEAVEKWMLTEEAQQVILQGYMHSVLKSVAECPWHSIDTDRLIRMDMGVKWENAYRYREDINLAWTQVVVWGEAGTSR